MSTTYTRRRLLGAGLVAGTLSLVTGSATVNAQPGAVKQKDRHPYIRAALRHLRGARKELKSGSHELGGHRVAALAAVDKAIEECDKALRF